MKVLVTGATGFIESHVVDRLFGVVADAALRLVGRRAPIPMGVGTELLCQRGPIDCGETWSALERPRTAVRDAVQEAAVWFRARGYA
ncbi:MAG: hypothetical protein ACYC8T_08010 [Myxococcaceae bacterium]